MPMPIKFIANCLLLLAFIAVSPVSHAQSTSGTTPPDRNQPSGQSAQQPPQQMPILAVINGEQITREQIATACLDRFGEPVLESLINKQLVFNECQAQNILITEQDVNDEIRDKAASFGFTAERYMDLICTQRKLTADRYKNDFVWQELALRRLAQNEIRIDPEDLRKQMEFEFGPKVQIREIVAENRQRAEQLLAEVRSAPESFGQMAKLNSLNPNSAAVKGLLPPIAKNAVDPQMEQLVFSMQPGDISDVLEVAGQFLIIKCERIFPAVEIASSDLPAVQERMLQEMSKAKLTDAAAKLFERLQQKVQIVNVYNNPELRQQMPGVAATVDGQRILLADIAEECIARFGSPMLTAEINRMILQQELKARNLQVTQQDITEEITRAAEADGYTRQDGVDVEGWIAYMTGDDPSRTDSLVADTVWPTCALKKLVASSVQITDEDLRKGFEANYGERVEVLAIVFRDQRLAQRTWQMAAANPTEEYFGQLANQYSIDPASQSNFGQIPPIQRHGGKPELEEEAFSLKTGEISQVIQDGEHFVIMLCTGRTTPVVTNMDDVREHLVKHIHDQKTFVAMAQRGKQLYEDAQIDNFLEGTSQPGIRERQASREAGTIQR